MKRVNRIVLAALAVLILGKTQSIAAFWNLKDITTSLQQIYATAGNWGSWALKGFPRIVTTTTFKADKKDNPDFSVKYGICPKDGYAVKLSSGNVITRSCEKNIFNTFLSYKREITSTFECNNQKKGCKYSWLTCPLNRKLAGPQKKAQAISASADDPVELPEKRIIAAILRDFGLEYFDKKMRFSETYGGAKLNLHQVINTFDKAVKDYDEYLTKLPPAHAQMTRLTAALIFKEHRTEILGTFLQDYLCHTDPLKNPEAFIKDIGALQKAGIEPKKAGKKSALPDGTIILPSCEEIAKILDSLGLDHFNEKTKFAKHLGNQKRTPLGVAVALDLAIDDYDQELSLMPGVLSKVMVRLKRARILTALLAEYPQEAESLLKELGLNVGEKKE